MRSKRSGSGSAGMMRSGVEGLRSVVAAQAVQVEAQKETQRQLDQLVVTVNDLATTVKVQEAGWQERYRELGRRISMVEEEQARRRDRGDSAVDQRQMQLTGFALSAAVNVLMLVLAVLVAHAWR